MREVKLPASPASYELRLSGNVPVDPNAVHEPEAKHDHQHKRAAVADQWQGHAGDRQQRDRHSHVLEDMGENERCDSNDQEQAQLIACKKSHEKTCQQEQRKRADEKHSSDKSPLLADSGENVIVVHSGRRKKAQLDLRVWRLESFSRPAARADGNERLIDRPGGPLLVDIGIDERGDPLLLVRLQTEIDRDRDKRDADQNDANQDSATEGRRRTTTPGAPVSK